MVALPLRFVLPCLRNGQDPEAMRQHFGIAPGARLLLLSVGRDRYLEEYWAERSIREWPLRLASFGIDAATTPNFSFFRDAPRPHVIFNRRRILITAAEFSSAGIATIPHLNAQNDSDWDFWASLLGQQDDILYVAKEFQTGLQIHEEGREAVRQLARLQQRIGRELRPVIVGGTQYLELIAQHFKHPTFVESSPFFKAQYRQAATLRGDCVRWERAHTDEGEPLDALFRHNITVTEQSIAARLRSAAQGTPIAPRTKVQKTQRFGVSVEQQTSLPL
jgi:hypothetical protein